MQGDRVGVVGLGYVGLPLSMTLIDGGYEVIGVDIDDEKITELRGGRSPLSEVDDRAVAERLHSFRPTTNYDELSDVAGVAVCVPTPLEKTGQPDLSALERSANRLAEVVDPRCTIVLESTVYPGATEEVVGAAFENRGHAVGSDVYVAHSPERFNPGDSQYTLAEIPKVVGGITAACTDRALVLYDPAFEELIPVDGVKEAELTKVLENTYRSVNIGLINEFALVAHELGIDIWTVVEAAATKPFGFASFQPGPGLGGHCIPVDPLYLSWAASRKGIDTEFIDLADDINRRMPEFVVSRVLRLLNDHGLAVSRSSILVVGVAYKPNVGDVRESPAYDIIGELEQLGADVSYHDPFVTEFHVENRTYRSVGLDPESIAAKDCIVIVTDHDRVDTTRLVEHGSLVFDSRNGTDGSDASNVHRL